MSRQVRWGTWGTAKGQQTLRAVAGGTMTEEQAAKTMGTTRIAVYQRAWREKREGRHQGANGNGQRRTTPPKTTPALTVNELLLRLKMTQHQLGQAIGIIEKTMGA